VENSGILKSNQLLCLRRENPKSEARNSKQIPMNKIKNAPKTSN
jgi:hypothetical protein